MTFIIKILLLVFLIGFWSTTKFIVKVLILVGLLGYLLIRGFTQVSAQVIDKTQIEKIQAEKIQVEKTQVKKTSKIEIDNFLSVVKKEVFQDILINGVTVKEGIKDCEIRYPSIKKILDNYKRPFTVLDIGASEGYFSIRIAAEYDCTCVMIEGDNALLLPEICRLNKPLSNLIVLEKFITPKDLKELGECEHFDVVLAFNVIHQMKNAWKETIDNLLTLGDNIFIENPPPDCRTAANKEVLPLIDAYLAQDKKGKVIGQVPRYGRPGLPSPDQKYSNVYLFEMNKNVLNKNKKNDWKKGINLWTFKNLNGVYPTKDIICQEIKRLSTFSHGDFLPWNMVIQGDNLELIDCDDNNVPGYMHNYEACLAQYEAKL